MKSFKILLIVFLMISIGLLIKCAPNIFYSNSGSSISRGNPGFGTLENAYQVEHKTNNSKYYSPLSYYLMGNAYVNSKLYQTLLDAYKECEQTCPRIDFRIMECSDKKGGKLLMHRTHKNGLSVDFMVPKIENGKQIKRYDNLGLFHSLLDFDSSGRFKLNKRVEIDFETISRHIIALDNAAKANGLIVSKVILKQNLKDDLYETEFGKEIRRRSIYFVRNLSKDVDMAHDDHYHIDFEVK